MKKFLIIFLLLPVIAFAQDAPKKQVYFFYGEQCPHCHTVDAFFKENGFYDKYQITKLEVSNPFNGKLLLKFEDVFDSPNKKMGSIPAIAFGDKFIEGDQPIIDAFEKEISATDAKELPDPDKKTNISADASQKDQIPGGNKKYTFPVILVVLIILGGGVYFLINRKKT